MKGNFEVDILGKSFKFKFKVELKNGFMILNQYLRFEVSSEVCFEGSSKFSLFLCCCSNLKFDAKY